MLFIPSNDYLTKRTYSLLYKQFQLYFKYEGTNLNIITSMRAQF